MPLKKKPVTGMKDIEPREMAIREYVLGKIKETYRGYGFLGIETPCVDHLENLTSKQGGDNEKLIFKILKRGEKLDLSSARTDGDICEEGLRYDLTLPLARFYANHGDALPMPFKALQTGPVWRADRPQKGRFRQFVQCDIDVLGDPSPLAEIELIQATADALSRICPDRAFTVRVNDRGILRGMAAHCGFPAESFDRVFIILDKMDKIGAEGVEAELIEAGYAPEAVGAYLGMFGKVSKDAGGLRTLGEILGGAGAASGAGDGNSHVSGALEAVGRLSMIMETVAATTEGRFALEFDPTLVRGMAYYTGTIFEVSMEGFGGSVAGGGRYDEMIGKFTGIPTPACGFSIGFERIVTILLDAGFAVPQAGAKKAYLFEKGLPQERFVSLLAKVRAERGAGGQVLVAQMNKNKKFQKQKLLEEGYGEIAEVYVEELRR
ncbi:MAG: ATP phosphoribosyltransferase regulatory subunit [Lachnospiraceae bacterium]|jgi:histidyl-tRNA synthetase|nr:ATP phosphoribosyltransferase regulatory subunit [Lachnospiraceae bacterium]